MSRFGGLVQVDAFGPFQQGVQTGSALFDLMLASQAEMQRRSASGYLTSQYEQLRPRPAMIDESKPGVIQRYPEGQDSFATQDQVSDYDRELAMFRGAAPEFQAQTIRDLRRQQEQDQLREFDREQRVVDQQRKIAFARSVGRQFNSPEMEQRILAGEGFYRDESGELQFADINPSTRGMVTDVGSVGPDTLRSDLAMIAAKQKVAQGELLVENARSADDYKAGLAMADEGRRELQAALMLAEYEKRGAQGPQSLVAGSGAVDPYSSTDPFQQAPPQPMPTEPQSERPNRVPSAEELMRTANLLSGFASMFSRGGQQPQQTPAQQLPQQANDQNVSALFQQLGMPTQQATGGNIPGVPAQPRGYSPMQGGNGLSDTIGRDVAARQLVMELAQQYPNLSEEQIALMVRQRLAEMGY